jgi:hypothetical protein
MGGKLLHVDFDEGRKRPGSLVALKSTIKNQHGTLVR